MQIDSVQFDRNAHNSQRRADITNHSHGAWYTIHAAYINIYIYAYIYSSFRAFHRIYLYGFHLNFLLLKIILLLVVAKLHNIIVSLR